MTDHTDLLEQSFELNLNNYGPEDVERLNNWAIKAYAVLKALEAEVKHLNLHLKATQSGRDAALTRLAELAKQEPIAQYAHYPERHMVGPDDGGMHILEALGDIPIGAKLYAAAGVTQLPDDPMDWPLPCDVTVGHGTMQKGVKLRTLVLRMKALYELATGQDADAVAGRSIEERIAISNAPPLNWAEVGRLIEAADRARAGGLVVGTSNWGAYICRSMGAQPSQAQPPAPSDTAREYMTGYSDAKEWAQTSRALDAQRYSLLRSCRGMEHDPLLTVVHEMDGVLWGADLDDAVDAAIKQGGQQ